MKRMIVCVVFLLVVPLSAQDDGDLPGLDDLDDGWNIIMTGEGTVCARGTPYQFFVRPGETDRLMIYFQGGGACWNSLTCREGGTFDDSVNDDEIDDYGGIFNFENPDNPVSDYSIVFVPYCTADIHSGDNVMEYRTAEINHNGHDNAAAVLEWTYATYPEPEMLIVTGSSAGAYGPVFHAPDILETYPDAQTVIFGDAGVGVTPVGWSVLLDWNIYANLPETFDPETFTIEDLYRYSMDAHPDVRFGQFTHYADAVQERFYNFSGLEDDAPTWTEGMLDLLDSLDAAANFTSYVAPGTDHTILALDEFYTLEVAGEPLLDWFNTLITGDDLPEPVRCVDCD